MEGAAALGRYPRPMRAWRAFTNLNRVAWHEAMTGAMIRTLWRRGPTERAWLALNLLALPVVVLATATLVALALR